MNFKTTFGLAAALCVLLLGYLILRPRLESAQDDLPEAPDYGASTIARDLVEPELGDVVKVVCRRTGEEEWVFEKVEPEGAARSEWRMTSPLELKVVSYEVDKFGRQLGGLTYEVSYKPGEPGAISAAEAGLDPPGAIVTMTDAEGAAVSVEIGNPASSRETYVRLIGSDEIAVGQADLRKLIKSKPLEYRDGQVWNFDAANVIRVEIDDRADAEAPVSYAFVNDGSRWMMESPVTARATSKVDEMLRAMGRLRAIKWHDDRPEKLAMYGLDPPTLTVRATVTEPRALARATSEEVEGDQNASAEMEVESTETSESTTEPRALARANATVEEEGLDELKIETTVYELHLSNRSPIGEDTKTYLRVGDESMVGTLMKSTADQFKPVMAAWRDMQVTTVNASAATRIELSTPQGSATLVKELGRWSFEADGGPAEEPVVTELLSTIEKLTAVAFVDGAVTDPSAFGLDEPRARIRLTVPGVENAERITVGGYTDAQAKRLVYVRRGEAASVAKVRGADVAKLIQAPHVYRDRTILGVHPKRFQRIALSIESRFVAGTAEVSFTREGDTWSMAAPVEASVRTDRLDQLIDELGDLRAESILADADEPAAVELDEPAATLTLTYENQADVAATELGFATRDGRFYAKRSDRQAVYEITEGFFQKLFLEYRSGDVIDFDDSDVRWFSIRSGDQTHLFQRLDEQWVYLAEPDLPLDSKKIENLLLQIGDLETDRYVHHTGEHASDYGLSSPSHEVTVMLDDGTGDVLRVSGQACDGDSQKRFYAVVDGREGVFLLTSTEIDRFVVSLAELEAEP